MASQEYGRAPADYSPEAQVPNGSRVYAVGDCHGRADLLADLHESILADSRTARSRKVVIYLGDYVDRGPGAREVIDLLLEKPLPGFTSVYLRGNHEDFMLRFLEEPHAAVAWLMNGGDATLRSYGVDLIAAPPRGDRLLWLRRELLHRLPHEHLDFLKSLQLTHVEGGYLFVHAGIRPGVALDQQDPYDLVWIREPFLNSEGQHGKVVIHGHTPSWEPVIRENRICIDTGACYGGTLTALVLEGARRRFLRAG